MQTLPFLNQLVVLTVTGAQLISALENSLSRVGVADVVENPSGRFMQVSGLSFRWYFQGGQPVLGRVHVTGLGEITASTPAITLVTNNYVAGGGDGYDVFESITTKTRLGLVVFDTVAQYLSAGNTAVTPLPSQRIQQDPSKVTLQLGLLCEGPSRETCDHCL